MAEAFGPLEDVDGDILLPYILSQHGFLADMGVKFWISKLPSFAKAASLNILGTAANVFLRFLLAFNIF